MAKILLVEDDNNLREIYGARLTAEGYQIVAAPDGEEALALAVKEKPDLIITDVMMPKISGFDMLDILRNAPETKNTKVIMMTALSQAEDKERADKLGADMYLVKSQVTLEDVAASVRKVLEGPGNTSPTEGSEEASTPQAETPEAQQTPPAIPEPPKEPEAPAPPVAVPPVPTVEPPAPVISPPPVQSTPVPVTSDSSAATPVQPAPVTPVPPQPQISTPSSTPAPEPPKEPEAAAPAPTVAPTSAPEPPTPVTKKIEVILPDSAEEEKTEEKPKEEVTPVPAPVPVTSTESSGPTTESTPASPDIDASLSIGPNLAEALAEEENVAPAGLKPTPPESQNKPNEAVETPSDPSSVIKPQTPPAAEPVEDNTPPQPVPPKSVGGERVIQPIDDPTQKTDLNELLAQEEAKQTGAAMPPSTTQPDPAQVQTPDHPDDLSKISL